MNVGQTTITDQLSNSVTNTNKQAVQTSKPQVPSTSSKTVKPKKKVALDPSPNMTSSSSTNANSTRKNGGLPSTSSRNSSNLQNVDGLPSTISHGSGNSQSEGGLPSTSSRGSSSSQGGTMVPNYYPSGLSLGLNSWGTMLGLSTNQRQEYQEHTESQAQDQDYGGFMRPVQIGHKRPLMSGNNSTHSGYTTSMSSTIGNRPIDFNSVMNSRGSNGTGSIGSIGKGNNGTSGYNGSSSIGVGNGRGSVNSTGNSSDSSTISKSDPNMIDPEGKRILNPEGLNTPSRSLLLEDLVIDDIAYERLKTSITYEGYVGKHAVSTKTWVYVTNNNNDDKTWLVCIDEHIAIVTKLLYVSMSDNGIYGKSENKHWNKIQTDLLEKANRESTNRFNNIITRNLAIVLISDNNSAYTNKWAQQAHVFGMTMKCRLNTLDKR